MNERRYEFRDRGQLARDAMRRLLFSGGMMRMDSFGKPIPTTSVELGDALGISRTPVREAIFVFDSMGLVRNVPGVGMLPAESLSPDSMAIVLSVHEMIGSRTVIKLAQERENVRNFPKLVAQKAFDEGNLGEYRLLLENYHLYLADQAQMNWQILMTALDQIYIALSQKPLTRADVKRDLKDQEDLYNAIVRGNQDKALAVFQGYHDRIKAKLGIPDSH